MKRYAKTFSKTVTRGTNRESATSNCILLLTLSWWWRRPDSLRSWVRLLAGQGYIQAWVSCAVLCRCCFCIDVGWWTVWSWTWNFNINILSQEKFFRLSKMPADPSEQPAIFCSNSIGAVIYLLLDLCLGPPLLSIRGLRSHAYNIIFSKTRKFLNFFFFWKNVS